MGIVVVGVVVVIVVAVGRRGGFIIPTPLYRLPEKT